MRYLIPVLPFIIYISFHKIFDTTWLLVLSKIFSIFSRNSFIQKGLPLNIQFPYF
jgi:hypothetical protein